jgi:hypothetical protein
MYGFGILIGAALGIGGGIVGLLLAYSTHGLTPLFGPASVTAFGIYVLTMFGPIASILAALIAFKKQSFIQMWVPELAGMLMFCGALAMVGFVATDRMTLLPAAASALGALILLVASDELKTAPAA